MPAGAMKAREQRNSEKEHQKAETLYSKGFQPFWQK